VKKFLLSLQLCLALFLVSALAEEKDSSTKSKAVPLEKKLDKRGLLDLGYGYGINGLDVGYIGGGHHGGAYHQAAPVIQNSHHSYGAHSYGAPFYLGQQTDYHKTVTHYKGVPVPYEVSSNRFAKISSFRLNANFFFTFCVTLRSRSTSPSSTRNTSHIPSR
jgi:hypothetical protein